MKASRKSMGQCMERIEQKQEKKRKKQNREKKRTRSTQGPYRLTDSWTRTVEKTSSVRKMKRQNPIGRDTTRTTLYMSGPNRQTEPTQGTAELGQARKPQGTQKERKSGAGNVPRHVWGSSDPHINTSP
ncbi:hypothetical protein Pmani_021560 [Petrolisthes manimaculis]|uniref:Uncharacterized protein n=1 Tax=Petrolisthes manimaculis TaxID=1843537 RepID=A0AAE1U1K0_9EUCA|nr:hypothetical protein Pmani_021560 [Petrolisthes manimaculis]